VTDFASRTTRRPTRHKRRYAISHHALERFRERVDEELRHRGDDDLMNLLDDRVCHADRDYQVRDPRAPEAITTLHEVHCRKDTYFAVERDGTVVTLLDEQMARNNFGGQWTPVLNAPFAKLRDLKIAPPAPAKPPAPTPPVDEVDEALAACARARAVQRDREATVAALLAELDRAAAALREATAAVDLAHRRLVDLTTEEDE
jgi:hypothetical protein